MKTPRQRFQELKLIAEQHRNIVDSSQFGIAMDMAILQLLWELPPTDDMQKAAANHWRLMGALSYMKKLAHLGDVAPDKPPVDDGNLDHKA